MLIDRVMILYRLIMAELETLRRRLHFLQHAVDPKSDAKFLVQRFEVNVARAGAMRSISNIDTSRTIGASASSIGSLPSHRQVPTESMRRQVPCSTSAASSAVP